MPRHGPHLFRAGGLWEASGDLSGKFLPVEALKDFGDTPRGWLYHSGEVYPAGEDLGGSNSHNNMPPYVTVSIWKRIA